MPRRTLSAQEKKLFAEDPKLQQYETQLNEASGQLGGHLERKRTCEKRIQELRAQIKAEESQRKKLGDEIQGLRSRVSHVRDLIRRRRRSVRDRHYKKTVNPLRRELGMTPLKLNK